MNEHTTIPLSKVLPVAATGPVFIPLVDLPAGVQLMESECELALDGPTEDVEIRLVLAEPGTAQGALPEHPLAAGDRFRSPQGPQPVAWTAHLPEMPSQPGVLGIAMDTGTLPAATRLRGTLVYVRGRL